MTTHKATRGESPTLSDDEIRTLWVDYDLGGHAAPMLFARALEARIRGVLGTHEMSDAKRYRWLRDESGADVRSLLGMDDFTSLDAFIDRRTAGVKASPTFDHIWSLVLRYANASRYPINGPNHSLDEAEATLQSAVRALVAAGAGGADGR